MRHLSQDYERALDALVDNIFDAATYDHDWTWQALASEAGIATSTVNRLGNRITRLPQLRTIYRLAKAVGMDVAIVKKQLRVRKAG